MADESVEIVKRLCEAFPTGDVDELLTLSDPDIEIRSRLTETERPIYRGHEGLLEYHAAIFEVFTDWTTTIQNARASGDAVVVHLHVTALAPVSGAPVEDDFWSIARVRESRVTFIAFFRTEAEAEAAT